MVGAKNIASSSGCAVTSSTEAQSILVFQDYFLSGKSARCPADLGELSGCLQCTVREGHMNRFQRNTNVISHFSSIAALLQCPDCLAIWDLGSIKVEPRSQTSHQVQLNPAEHAEFIHKKIHSSLLHRHISRHQVLLRYGNHLIHPGLPKPLCS
jgi:hypothetical protein